MAIPSIGQDPWGVDFLGWANNEHNNDGSHSISAGSLGTGTPGPTTFLNGDLQWAVPAGAVADLDDLSDISGTQAAGTSLRRGASDYVHVGRVFSASAYGVVGDNNNATASANQTNMEACINAAESAGAGSGVLLDWIGTAYFNGNLELKTGLVYHCVSRNTICKLANSRPAETHVWRSTNFDTLRGTNTASSGVPYGFTLSGEWCVDGNKANNATGGVGIGIYAYEFHVPAHIITQNTMGAGWWSEYPNTGEPIIGGYGNQRQRAAKVHKIETWNSDCLALDGVGAASCVIKGPIDAEYDAIEAVRNGTVAGTGILFGSGGASTVVHQLTHWLNFDIGVDVQAGNVRIVQIHSEGANTNVRVAAGEFKISGGEIFGPQAGGTNLHFVSGNFNHIHVNMPSCSSATGGGTFINFAGGNQDSEIYITASEGSSFNTTLTTGAFLPDARVLSISGRNYGSGTMTGGLIPEFTTGQFRFYRANGPFLSRSYVEMDEITDAVAASPASNKGRIYMRDNGSGKTQFVAVFPSGAVQVLATEP